MTSDDQEHRGLDDRGRGILAPVDRAFLRGEKTYEHRQSAYDRREKIRQRIADGIIDFLDIYYFLPAEEREKIFEHGPNPELHGGEIVDGMMEAMAFFCLALTDQVPLEEDEEGGGHHSWMWDSTVKAAMSHAYRERDIYLKEFNLHIESEEIPGLADMKEMLEQGGKLPTSVYISLIETGVVDTGALNEFLLEELPEEESRDENGG